MVRQQEESASDSMGLSCHERHTLRRADFNAMQPPRLMPTRNTGDPSKPAADASPMDLHVQVDQLCDIITAECQTLAAKADIKSAKIKFKLCAPKLHAGHTAASCNAALCDSKFSYSRSRRNTFEVAKCLREGRQSFQRSCGHHASSQRTHCLDNRGRKQKIRPDSKAVSRSLHTQVAFLLPANNTTRLAQVRTIVA